MGLIGHNGGPTLEPGASWRRHCWGAARAALLPTLPIEVVRTRVARARELGLDYRTYASVRAATGHDVVAFLFSSNALRVGALRPVAPQAVADKLARIAAGRIGLAVAPMPSSLLQAANPALDESHAAPWALARFADLRHQLRQALGNRPADRVILVGEGGLEAEWCGAARLAAYLPAERYFA